MGLLGNLAAAASDGLFGSSCSSSHDTSFHCEAHSAAAPDSHAAFLGVSGGSCGSSARVQPGLHGRTSFKRVYFTGPELENQVRTRLMYQSPDIYMTDISKSDKALRRHRFAGMHARDETPLHPMIRFKELHKKVHVHMVDTYNGDVFWDANYNMSFIPFMGSNVLKGSAVPMPENPGTQPMMRKFYIPKDDPGPHLFDLSINTMEGHYNDQNDTPWGEDEGFGNLHGHNAHIGVEVYRRPSLVESKTLLSHNGEPRMVEKGAREGAVRSRRSFGPVHQDNLERILNKEEDIFEDTKTGDDGRNYYGWMIKRSARKRNDYEYMFKPDIPPLVTPHHWVDPLAADAAGKKA